jgi:hypothetical protein
MFLHWKYLGPGKRYPYLARFAVSVAESRREPGEVWPKRRMIVYLATVAPTELNEFGTRVSFWDSVEAHLELAVLDEKLTEEQADAMQAQLARYVPNWTRGDYQQHGPWAMPPLGEPPKIIATHLARAKAAREQRRVQFNQQLAQAITGGKAR